MNSYALSDGSRKTKSRIDTAVKEAKKFYRLSRYDEEKFYCEACGRYHFLMDVSHIVSVDDCQKQGKSEQAWNPENFELLCRECHTKFEANKTLNEKREAYISEWFPELLHKYGKDQSNM